MMQRPAAGPRLAIQYRELESPEEKEKIARDILEQLPDWFGLADSREEYIRTCAGLPVWAAFAAGRPVGFIALRPSSAHTAELYVMGVAPRLHRQGVGRRLEELFEAGARQRGFVYAQVKTVDQGRYPEYDRTVAFYEAMGFCRLEVFPTLWDEWNPCLVLVKKL